MKYRSLVFTTNENNEVALVDIGNNIPKFANNITIAIDGSSSITGISYIDCTTAAILGTTACYREKESDGKEEDFVKYKVKLKQFIKQVFDANISNIKHTDYEEPFIGYTESSKVLMSIRTSVKEIVYENEPAYDKFVNSEINNMLWKRLWLEPEKVPVGTDNQKKAVKEKLLKAIPAMHSCEQDEIDATCMGYVATIQRLKGKEEELKGSKTAKPFKYNITFIGVEEGGHVGEQVMLQELGDVVMEHKVPQRVLENGIGIVELDGHGLFDKHVYKNMGDSDKLLVLGFDNGKYVNIIIEHKVAWMLENFGKLYAVVWRKSRKS